MVQLGVLRGLLPALAVATPLLLAGCGGDDAPPQVFAPLNYAYLKPLHINVASIEVNDSWAPPPGVTDLSAQSPAVPLDALREMGRDRLVPSGASGRAVYTIESASIRPDGDRLDGLLKVRLDVYTSDGHRAAYAEAAVARSATGPDEASGMPAALYGLTRQMMSDMNVEFEFQLRRSLGDWFQVNGGLAPPPVAVQQQALPPPGSLPPAGAFPPADAPGGTPTRYRLVPSPPPGSPPTP